jgi:xylose isomerase
LTRRTQDLLIFTTFDLSQRHLLRSCRFKIQKQFEGTLDLIRNCCNFSDVRICSGGRAVLKAQTKHDQVIDQLAQSKERSKIKNVRSAQIEFGQIHQA